MQEYKNDKLVVRYDPAICIHAGACVRGLPSVFNVSKKPWIDVNGASPAAIIEQVKECPSGALTYEVLKDKTTLVEPVAKCPVHGQRRSDMPTPDGYPFPSLFPPNGTQEAPCSPARGFFLWRDCAAHNRP